MASFCSQTMFVTLALFGGMTGGRRNGTYDVVDNSDNDLIIDQDSYDTDHDSYDLIDNTSDSYQDGSSTDN